MIGRPFTPVFFTPGDLGAVALGGFAGAPLRYGVGTAFPHTTSEFPWPTFALNIVGAFLLGMLLQGLASAGDDTGGRRRLRLLLGTGLLGTFTTYSTLALELDLLIDGGYPGLAAAYGAASAVAGLAAAGAGMLIAGRVATPGRPRR